MADLLLAGTLNFMGTVDLVGKVKVNNVEALVEAQRGVGTAHGQAPAPVPIPPPPAPPSDAGLDVWIFKSFNATVTASGKKIVTQGMCAQGNPGTATWPGMVQASIANATVTINNIPMNVVGDLGVILPSGAPATFSTSGQ